MIPFGCRTRLRVLSYVLLELIADRCTNKEASALISKVEASELNHPEDAKIYVKPETAEHRDPQL